MPLTVKLPVTVKLPPTVPLPLVVTVADVRPPVSRLMFLLASTTSALLAAAVPGVTESSTLSSAALVRTLVPSIFQPPAISIVLTALNVFVPVHVLFPASEP